MRLWHKDLIPYLPRQQLLGQWRECCAIARNIEKDGTPNHVLVNRILDYEDGHFNMYAFQVMKEMRSRGYKVDWDRFRKHRKHPDVGVRREFIFEGWHNGRYLRQCLANLQEKADCGSIPAEEWKKITDRWKTFKLMTLTDFWELDSWRLGSS